MGEAYWRYREQIDRYIPLEFQGRPIGGADFDAWLRHHIVQMSVYGYDRGLRGDALRSYVDGERRYAIQRHNAKIEPNLDSMLRHALRHIDTQTEWMSTVLRDLEEGR